jgi:hypothetical protein
VIVIALVVWVCTAVVWWTVFMVKAFLWIMVALAWCLYAPCRWLWRELTT